MHIYLRRRIKNQENKTKASLFIVNIVISLSLTAMTLFIIEKLYYRPSSQKIEVFEPLTQETINRMYPRPPISDTASITGSRGTSTAPSVLTSMST